MDGWEVWMMLKTGGILFASTALFLEAAYFVSEFGTGFYIWTVQPLEPVDTFEFDHFILQCHNLVSGVYKTSCRTGKYDAPHVSFLLHIIHHIIFNINIYLLLSPEISTPHPIPPPSPFYTLHMHDCFQVREFTKCFKTLQHSLPPPTGSEKWLKNGQILEVWRSICIWCSCTTFI